MKDLVKKIGRAQGMVLMAIAYFLLAGIVSLVMLFSRHHPFRRQRDVDSYWQNRKQTAIDENNYLKPY